MGFSVSRAYMAALTAAVAPRVPQLYLEDMQARLPTFLFGALLLGAMIVTACSEDNSDGFGNGTGYTPQPAATMPPLPPGAGPYDGGTIPQPPRDSGTPTDTGTPADAGTITDSGAAADGAG
jgi:hypothetical protein